MDEMIFVKTLEKPNDKNGKPYTKITDQNLKSWSLFRTDIDFQVGKAYLFTYTINEKGWPDISKITPLVNIFVQKALKETANLNDIKKDIGISTSYAVELCKADKIQLTELFVWSDKIHDYLITKANSLMPKEAE